MRCSDPATCAEAAILRRFLPKVPRKHTVLRIPGSHTLYVGPLSCTRRHAIHAHQYADRRDVSFLYITQADVVSGRYEDLMVEAIGELLAQIQPQPHIFMLALFCIDDFLGTDETALLERLRDTYPECQFAVEHIDPVSTSENQSMVARKVASQYSFIRALPEEEHDAGITFLGSFVPLPEDCEFLELLKEWGCGPVRALFSCETYDDYQDLGKSQLAIVLRLMNTVSADRFRDRLGVPYYIFTPGYDAQAIAKGYNDIAALLGKPARDFSREIEACRVDAEATVRLLDGLPVALDCAFSLVTFSTAKVLLDYGFNVRLLFRSNHRFKLDEEAERFILENCPQVAVTQAGTVKNWDGVRDFDDCLALGTDCGHLLGTSRVVDIWHDEGVFGFQGIHRLMKCIREAFERGECDAMPTEERDGAATSIEEADSCNGAQDAKAAGTCASSEGEGL